MSTLDYSASKFQNDFFTLKRTIIIQTGIRVLSSTSGGYKYTVNIPFYFLQVMNTKFSYLQ